LQPSVWVVDRLDWWRTTVVAALRDAGFPVRAYDSYDAVLATLHSTSTGPDLVLLGCAGSHLEEAVLLRELVLRRWPVIVFASSLTLQDLREFFLAGASDVAERPQTANHLLSLVAAMPLTRPTCQQVE
jgi:DNA-binding NtrC family response regulator